jgi:dTDP-4-amino-4,6-dideoxygalactose transaminase
VTGQELVYIAEACSNAQLSGDGHFKKRCHTWLEQHIHYHKALLTQSTTAALEMAALLFYLKPGEEVIMPSYTFVSTADAFVWRCAVPVFIDIRPDTLNMDETLIEEGLGFNFWRC